MHKKSQIFQQKGNTLVLALIILVILGVAVLAIYYFGFANNQEDSQENDVPFNSSDEKEKGPVILTPVAVPEEEGIVKIKALPEYSDFIELYGEAFVSVKAVDLDEPGENAFLQEIDTGFSTEPGCVIVLEAKDDGYLYQLNEGFDLLYKISLKDFREKSKNVDQSVMDEFYASLK